MGQSNFSLGEWHKQHPRGSTIGLSMLAVGLLVAIEEAVGILRFVAGMISASWEALLTPNGRRMAVLLSLAVFLWFWFAWPWIVTKGKKHAIRKLCSRIEQLASTTRATKSTFTDCSTAAGLIVIKMHEVGAYRDDPQTDEEINLVRSGKSLVQISCKNDNHPAAQGEYQAFWIARRAACLRLDMSGETIPSLEETTTGCNLIANDVRRLNGIVEESPIRKPIPDTPDSPPAPPAA